jgi:hypothetical protein
MQYYNDILEKLPNRSTTDIELNMAVSKMTLRNLKFLGVFAENTRPVLKNSECCIFNLDTSKMPGSHWVALIGNILYDSFGRKHQEIVPKRSAHYIDSDPNPEQKISEMNCGARSIAFIMCFDKFGIDTISVL